MISNDDLLALGDELSSCITVCPHTLAIAGCDNTLRHTLAWLDAHQCDRSMWVSYLHANEAYCDCEVWLRVAALPRLVPSAGGT
jgi:hypothetical protein